MRGLPSGRSLFGGQGLCARGALRERALSLAVCGTLRARHASQPSRRQPFGRCLTLPRLRACGSGRRQIRRLAAQNKCLAPSNKSCAGCKATKRQRTRSIAKSKGCSDDDLAQAFGQGINSAPRHSPVHAGAPSMESKNDHRSSTG
jgi:hypothetical protein